MNENELEQLIRTRLRDAGLPKALNSTISQFLHMGGDNFFVELVLTDAAKLPEARNLAAELTTQLQNDEIQVSWVIGVRWELEKIEYLGICRGESGGIRSAECFQALVSSGSVKQAGVRMD